MSELITNRVPNVSRFQNFVIFEPSSLRVRDKDVFLQGDGIQDFYNNLLDKVIEKEQTIKEKILQNRLSKIGQMLELLKSYENVIMSKFFDRIWRRYTHISHLGENVIDLASFLDFFPEYNDKYDDVIALRAYPKDLSIDNDDMDDDAD